MLRCHIYYIYNISVSLTKCFKLHILQNLAVFITLVFESDFLERPANYSE